MTSTIPRDAAAAAPPPPTAISDPGHPRSLHVICEDARRATCGHCWAHPGVPCVTEGGARGYHVARFGRAFRRGLISGRALVAVLHCIGVFTGSTVVWDGDR